MVELKEKQCAAQKRSPARMDAQLAKVHMKEVMIKSVCALYCAKLHSLTSCAQRSLEEEMGSCKDQVTAANKRLSDVEGAAGEARRIKDQIQDALKKVGQLLHRNLMVSEESLFGSCKKICFSADRFLLLLAALCTREGFT